MIRPPTKTERILETLLERPLTRFQAEQIGDHSLPSTVASLMKIGVNVSRRRITVPTRFGVANCCEYWIASEHAEQGRTVLKTFWKRRGFDVAA
ncbi:hypothetical protein [Porticoccus sp.]